MANPGVAPLDPTSEVGKFRLMIGDTEYVPLDPPEPGFGDYTLFSDAEIEVFLEQGEGPEEAAYFAYLQLAGSAALEAKSVKDFDLQVDLSKRAQELRLIAQMWRDRADALSADIFESFDTKICDRWCCELCERPSCGGGCRGGLFL